jgi:hypothetical protein
MKVFVKIAKFNREEKEREKGRKGEGEKGD